MEEASPPWRTTSQTRSGSISPIFCCCYLCFAPYDVDHRCVRHRTAPRPFFGPQWTQPAQAARQQAISSSDVHRLCCVIVYVCVLTALGEKSNQAFRWLSKRRSLKNSYRSFTTTPLFTKWNQTHTNTVASSLRVYQPG